MPARRAPLLLTVRLPPDTLAWPDALRRAHFPVGRKKLAAHVTPFQAMPVSVESELRELLAALAETHQAPEARVSGLMKPGEGTALAIDSPCTDEHREMIRQRMQGALTRRDTQPLRLHITIQNKVTVAAARTLRKHRWPDDRPPVFPLPGD